MRRFLVQERRGQQEERDLETDEHEGDQEEPDDHPARHHPGDPHTRLLLRPSPPAMARAGGGVGAHLVVRIASRKLWRRSAPARAARSLTSTAMTQPPASRAICSACRPTPPTPISATVVPGRTCARLVIAW